MNMWKMIEISTAKSLDAEYSQLELKRVGIGGNQYLIDYVLYVHNIMLKTNITSTSEVSAQ